MILVCEVIAVSSLEYLIEERIVRYKEEYKFEPFLKEVSREMIRKSIEHTLLKPTATVEDIVALCEQAKEYKFCGVCVNPSFAETSLQLLKGSGVKVISVVGFPLGTNTQLSKAQEASELIRIGVDEIDMVIHVGMLKSHEWSYVYEDIRGVVEACKGKPVKVIIETCYLTNEEKIAACVISELAGASFVKTSTGFGPAGATVEDVNLMKWSAPKLSVKASGGIRSYNQAIDLIKAGATRIGTSSGTKIISEEV